MRKSISVKSEVAVLIVEDHLPMREAIRSYINRSFPSLSVIEVSNGAGALDYLEAHCPCLVLMDINLPDSNGLDLTRDILKSWPGTFVVAISIDTSAAVTERALASGAAQFIGKDKLFTSLLPLVGAASTLEKWIMGLESHFAIADESLLSVGHSTEQLQEVGVLQVGED